MTSTSRLILLLAALLALPWAASAQISDLDLRLPWDIDAESTSFDGKTSMIIFRGLRLSQGRISIDADEGRASNTEGEDGLWQFNGNVVINVDNGRIACDSAELRFAEYQLRQATVIGTPATFELKRRGSDDVTYAEAGRLSYDVVQGIIEFSDEATITEAGNQISSGFLVYNIKEQRIDAESSGSGDSRVRVTYTPTNGTAKPGNGEPPAEPGDKDDNP